MLLRLLDARKHLAQYFRRIARHVSRLCDGAVRRGRGLFYWRSLARARALLKEGEFEQAEAAFEALAHRRRHDPRGLAGLAKISVRRRRLAEAIRRWRRVCEQFPDYLLAQSGYASALLEHGDLEEAAEVFARLKETRRDRPEGYIGLARVAGKAGQWELALEQYREAQRLFPRSYDAQVGLAMSLVELNAFDEARDAYLAMMEAFPASTRSIQQKLIKMYWDKGDMQAALTHAQALHAAEPEDPAAALRLTRLLMFEGRTEEALQIIERYWNATDEQLSTADRFRVRVQLACALIAAGRPREAERVYDAIKDEKVLQDDPDFSYLEVWRLVEHGQIDASRKVFRERLRHRHAERLRKLGGQLVCRRKPSNFRIVPGDVVLLTVVRDEADLIRTFHEYYTSIGVDWFIVVDNASSDGTAEYLESQPNVCLYWTDKSFSGAGQGDCWVNSLFDTYDHDHWWLHVDADEFLVVPHVEEHGLRPTINYMSDREDEAMVAFMMDMYPGRFGDLAARRGATDQAALPWHVCPYFDNNYRFTPSDKPPHVDIRGGVRERLFDVRSPILTKTPIIRSGRDIRLLRCGHFISPARVADVSGALLHFKIFGDVKTKFAMRAARKEHAHRSRLWIDYAEWANNGKDDDRMTCDLSVSYQSSHQLIELGLMRAGNLLPPAESERSYPQPVCASGSSSSLRR